MNRIVGLVRVNSVFYEFLVLWKESISLNKIGNKNKFGKAENTNKLVEQHDSFAAKEN